MESTLLPTAERLRHRRQEDESCIFSSHSATTLCTHGWACHSPPPPHHMPFLPYTKQRVWDDRKLGLLSLRELPARLLLHKTCKKPSHH